MSQPPHPHRSDRRGLVSVTMLIGLIIIGLVAANLLRVAVARRGLAMTEERQLQADALADSGVARALALLEANPQYSGETWEIAADQFGGRGTARVTIELKPDPEAPATRRLEVVANYLVAPSTLIRERRTLLIPNQPDLR